MQAPINIPTRTIGSVKAKLKLELFAETTSEYAEIIASAARAAAPIANPLPIAAVVSVSYTHLTLPTNQCV